VVAEHLHQRMLDQLPRRPELLDCARTVHTPVHTRGGESAD
jgi:hypothetical protein